MRLRGTRDLEGRVVEMIRRGCHHKTHPARQATSHVRVSEALGLTSSLEERNGGIDFSMTVATNRTSGSWMCSARYRWRSVAMAMT